MSTPEQKSQPTDLPEQAQGAKDLTRHNQPDYAAEVDQASSYVPPEERGGKMER